MTKRIVAIGFIFVCTSVAWAILGATIFARTYAIHPALREKVASTWGAAHVQAPPIATIPAEPNPRALPLEKSTLHVSLVLEPRRKGLLWYNSYRVEFTGLYTFRNTSPGDQEATFYLGFPTSHAVYDDLALEVDGSPVETSSEKAGARATVRIGGGRTSILRVHYRSQGLESWRYRLGSEVAQVRDFTLVMTTNFDAVDFPENTLSPTSRRSTAGGAEMAWTYRNLVSGYEIGMIMPERLQPGPLAGRISLFAPVSLLFFFFVIFMITTVRRIEIHPMNYFFLAAAFFAFHLLLAYLVDHVPVQAAFAVSSAVSVFLVVSYLRLVTGMRFAALEAGLAQLVYLVLFSVAFFFQGFTGLAVTIGSILTLFVAMQTTGRIRWSEIETGVRT